MIASVNASLKGPEREVLALLAESGLGYAGIAELLGLDRVGVAEIAARARLRLAGVEVASGCREHLPRLAARIDGEDLGGPTDPRARTARGRSRRCAPPTRRTARGIRGSCPRS